MRKLEQMWKARRMENSSTRSSGCDWYEPDLREKWEWDLTFGLQLPGSGKYAASFAFEKEDHTLGNALRYMIMKKCATTALAFVLLGANLLQS